MLNNSQVSGQWGNIGPGQLIQGRYQVGPLLGRGGMGSVFAGQDLLVGRKVAIKLIPHDSEESIQRVQREVQLQGTLSHHAIAQVFDRIDIEGGSLLVLELIEGRSLLDQVQEHGCLEPGWAVELIAQLAEGLAIAHDHGILHRDIKPQNVMLRDLDDSPVLLDFGLARREARGETFTQEGALLGTPAYMAPEQVDGGSVTRSADIYGLAATLFHALSGAPPFDGTELYVILRQVVSSPAPSLKSLGFEVPPKLEATLARALHKDPLKRFENARDFAQALRDSIQAAPVPSPLASRGILWILIAAIALLATLLGVYALAPRTLTISGLHPRLLLRLDGHSQPHSAQTTTLSLGLGKHWIEAELAGQVRDRIEVELQPFQSRSITLSLWGTLRLDSPDRGARISLRDDSGQVVRDLNGSLIEQRPLPLELELPFGSYHHRLETLNHWPSFGSLELKTRSAQHSFRAIGDRQVWSYKARNVKKLWARPELADADGDGLSELFGLGRKTNSLALDESSSVFALSGKSGSQLWLAAENINMWSGVAAHSSKERFRLALNELDAEQRPRFKLLDSAGKELLSDPPAIKVNLSELGGTRPSKAGWRPTAVRQDSGKIAWVLKHEIFTSTTPPEQIMALSAFSAEGRPLWTRTTADFGFEPKGQAQHWALAQAIAPNSNQDQILWPCDYGIVAFTIEDGEPRIRWKFRLNSHISGFRNERSNHCPFVALLENDPEGHMLVAWPDSDRFDKEHTEFLVLDREGRELLQRNLPERAISANPVLTSFGKRYLVCNRASDKRRNLRLLDERFETLWEDIGEDEDNRGDVVTVMALGEPHFLIGYSRPARVCLLRLTEKSLEPVWEHALNSPLETEEVRLAVDELVSSGEALRYFTVENFSARVRCWELQKPSRFWLPKATDKR